MQQQLAEQSSARESALDGMGEKKFVAQLL